MTIYSMIFENLENGWKHSMRPSLPFENKASVIVVKKFVKVDIKDILCCPTLIDLFALSPVFCLGLERRRINLT